MPGGLPDPLLISSDDGELRIDFASKLVSVNGHDADLTPTERDILTYLALRYGTVVPMDDLVEAVWGDWFGSGGHVSVHIHHIRRKLGPLGRLIITKRGLGYMLDAPTGTLAFPSPWMGEGRALFDMLQGDATARDVMWLCVERDLRISWVSDSATSMLGWAPREMIGRQPREFIVADDVPGFLANFPMRDGPARVTYDTHALRRDGSRIPVLIQANVFYRADGLRLAGLGEWSRRA